MGIAIPPVALLARAHGQAHWLEWCIAPEEVKRTHPNQYHIIVSFEDAAGGVCCARHVQVNPGVLRDYFGEQGPVKWQQLIAVFPSKTADEMLVIFEAQGMGQLFVNALGGL